MFQRGTMTKAIGVLATAALAMVGISGCADSVVGGDEPPADRDGLKVGLLLPLSGVFAPLGQEMLQGFELYLDQNDNTIGGLDVELIVEDSEGNAQRGIAGANKLIQEDGVDFAAGVVSSAVAQATAPLFDDAKIPFIVAVSTLNSLTGEAKADHVFRIGLSSYQAQYYEGKWAFDDLGAKTAFILASDYAGGHENSEDFRFGFEDSGGEVVGAAFPPLGTSDFQPFLSQARASGADAVFAHFAGSDAVGFVNQWSEFGLAGTMHLVGNPSITTGDVLPSQGESAVGVYSVMSYVHTLDNPTNQAFVAAYEAKYNSKPSYFAAYPYDAAQLMAHAIESTGGDVSDVAAVTQAMRGAEIDSPRGLLVIDSETHGTIQPMYIVQIQLVEGAPEPVVVGELGRFGEQPE